MARFARQVDYDHMVKEMLSQGASVEDAVQEVDETFVEGGYDLNSLFRYRNDEDMKQKVKVEGYLRMFEQLLVSHDASVNLVFGIQGLTQNLQSRGNETLRVGTLRLIEQKSTFSTILRVLAAMAAAGNDEEIEDRSNGEDSDEDEDEDENKILQKLHILTFASIIAQYPREEYVDYETLLCLSEETAPLLKTAIDADCGEARLVDKYCDILQFLVRIRVNRELLTQVSISNELGLAKKMLKSNPSIQQKIDVILSSL